MKKRPSILRKRGNFIDHRNNGSVLHLITEWLTQKVNTETIEGKDETATKATCSERSTRKSSRSSRG